MPVTGLPVALERTLTALLTDNTVTSWKVAGGEADNTVVVLRLKPASPQLSTTMADPVLNRTTQIQYFRKKPPSQLRRDDQRKAQHQQQKEASANTTDNTSSQMIDLPTVENVQEIGLQPTSDSEHALLEALHDEKGAENVCESNNTDGLSFQQALDNSDSTFQTSPTVDGFTTSIVKNYVATITDRSVQRRLRDTQRNTSFRKTVLQRSEVNDSIMVCESDDFVLEFVNTTDSDDTDNFSRCSYWYVKQEDQNMLPEERVKLATLRTGKRVSKNTHVDAQARALRKLQVLRGLLQFYLG